MTETDYYNVIKQDYKVRYLTIPIFAVFIVIWYVIFNYVLGGSSYLGTPDPQILNLTYITFVDFPICTCIAACALFILTTRPPEKVFTWKQKPIVVKGRSLCGQRSAIITEDEEIIFGDERVYFMFTEGSKYKVSLDNYHRIGEYKHGL
jgi:hypothetical protein